ncbi:MAG: CBS domain-containing protein [Nitrospiraceae bacterium]|nr:CBS domain-containing protein [Nitrospiraceae bacterium]
MKVVTNVEGNPAEGYRVVGDIVGTMTRRFKPDESALDVAIEMVTSHISGAPVVGRDYEFLGFINEGDIIRAVDRGTDLRTAQARDIMNSAFVAVKDDTSLTSVARLFEMGFQILPVVQNGKVTRSITRHDLLRAQLGLGPSVDET